MATNKFNNAGGALTIASAGTAKYTCPAATQATVHAVFISNVNGISEEQVTIQVHITATATTTHIGLNLPIPAQSTLETDKPINLQAGDYILISPSADGTLEFFLSILEMR